MKKLFILALLALVTLSGCDTLDYDMMVCGYHGMDSLKYEIRYKDNDIKNIAVVEYQDLRSVSDETYEKQLENIEKLRERRERYDGIKTSLEDNEKEVTLYTEIDYSKYDCNKDKLSLLQIKLQKKDFKDVKTLRDKLLSNSFECDEIVVKNEQ